MEANWAAENLKVIRTLMERATIYRRALAPIMLTTGALGVIAGWTGWWMEIEQCRAFGGFWLGVGGIGLVVAYGLVRRQAIKAREAFWSPPTRRVTQALAPPLLAGLATVLAMMLSPWQDPAHLWWFPPVWIILYGCAIHAAGFFMPRGIKLFGWLLIAAGCILMTILSLRDEVLPLRQAHWILGGFSGGMHLAYGAYLYLTEKAKTEA